MIKSAIYLIGICLILTGCHSEPPSDRQIPLSSVGAVSADLSADGKLALVTSIEQGTLAWDLEHDKQLWRWRLSDSPKEQVFITRFGPGDSHAVIASLETFAIWRLDTGQAEGYYSLPESRLRDIAISGDGRDVLVGREDGKAEWIDTRTGRRLQFLGHTEQVNSVDLSPNGRYALTGGNDYSAYLWDTQSGQVLHRFNHEGRVVMVRLDESGRYAFTADSRSGRIWDLVSGKELSRLDKQARFEVYTSARFVNQGQWLVTGAPSRKLTLWQVKDGKALANWAVAPRPGVKPPSAVVYAAALRDNDHLVSASSSGLAEIWTIK
jgi:WD40 repeat protein